MNLTSGLQTASQVLTVVAALIGVVVAVEGFSLGARLRRREAWLREAVEHENRENRRNALNSLLERTTARLVAALRVPFALYLRSAIYGALAVGLNAALWNVMMTAGDAAFWVLALVVSTLTIALAALSARWALRVYAERHRLMSRYLRDEVVGFPILRGQNQTGYWKTEFAIGFLFTSCAISAVLAATTITRQLSSNDPFWWVSGIMFVVIALATRFVQWWARMYVLARANLSVPASLANEPAEPV